MLEEAISLLSEYLAINTSNPPGDERGAAGFFAKLFEREGISYRIYEPEHGRSSIRAVLPGSGESEPLILLHHMDVVPASPEKWGFDPFGGAVIDGHICGRGALDTKSLGIMELMALLSLKRSKIKLKRDLVFLATADEEADGNKGMKWLMRNHPDDFRAGLVINEGGCGYTDLLPAKPVIMISTAEKGVCWLRLTASGKPGHGSMPGPDDAPQRLIRALHRLAEWDIPYVITPVAAEFFRNLSQGLDILAPYRESRNTEILTALLESSGLSRDPMVNAMTRNTLSPNVLRAGEKTNVIPGVASAELDVRLLPGQEVEPFMAMLASRISDERIIVERITANSGNESSWETEEYTVIKNIFTRRFSDAIITPSLLTGGSDSQYFRERGITAYGVFPVMITVDDNSRIHGIDEKISLKNMTMGTEIMREIVTSLCVD